MRTMLSMMSRTRAGATALVLTVSLASLGAAGAGRTAVTPQKGEMPKDSPGWVVVGDDVFTPWQFEPMRWTDSARYHYREGQEKAAAGELRKAASWLRYAAANALPISKGALETAARDLHALAVDIEHGQVVGANRLDHAIAEADHALASWHYFKAKASSAAKGDESRAAGDLYAAARYLRHAANSVRYSHASDAEDFFDEVDRYGGIMDDEEIPPTRLASDLAKLEIELQRMGDTLSKTAAVS